MVISADVLARFDKKVIRTETCWIWQGALDNGYGHFSIGYKNYGAHVFAYIRAKGNVPVDLQVDHLCRNRACVNPDHMEAVPCAINVLRGEGPAARNKRKTHCPRGHPYDATNTFIRRSGRRRCKICTNEKQRIK